MAEVILVVRAGAAADPAGREGLASMTASMLDEGAGGKDALALADARRLPGRDARRLCVAGTPRRCGCAVPSRACPRRSRSWPTSRCGPTSRRPSSHRLRKEALTDLLQARDEPGAIASRALAQAVYGTSHRYGKPPGGRRGAAPVLQAWRTCARSTPQRYAPESAALVVVGDVTASVLPRAREGVRVVEGRGRARAGAVRARGEAARGAHGVAGRQAGRGAVVAPHRPDRPGLAGSRPTRPTR